VSAAATAQAPAEDDPNAFDEGRAYVADSTIYVPFRPTQDDLPPDTWLFIMEHEAGRLGLVMDQMAYHHVAQGELRGEPWMVSF
jgi:hypothetical protein